MSIIAYVGLPGSGKTYDVVANQVVPALEADRRVVTNVPINRDAMREVVRSGEIVNLPYDVIAQEPAKIDEYATAGCVLILDELWRLWPAGERANKIPQPFKSLLAEHRHRVDSEGRSMQIVFVTQDLSQIAAFARQLVEQTFHHTKLTSVGARGTYRIDVFQGCVTGAVPPVNNRVREIFGKYEPRIFKLYQSHTMATSTSKRGKIQESTVDGRGNVFKRWSLWAGLGGAALAIVWGTSTLAGLLSGHGVEDTSVASTADAVHPVDRPTFSAAPVSSPVAKPSLTVPLRKAQHRYRLVGWIENPSEPDRSVAVISDGRGTIRVPLSSCQTKALGEYQCEFDGQVVTSLSGAVF